MHLQGKTDEGAARLAKQPAQPREMTRSVSAARSQLHGNADVSIRRFLRTPWARPPPSG